MAESNKYVQGTKEIIIPTIILDAMRDLKSILPETYRVLAGRLESGYFEKNQDKNSINNLADRLLETIEKGASDES
jgi:hypothetical protein